MNKPSLFFSLVSGLVLFSLACNTTDGGANDMTLQIDGIAVDQGATDMIGFDMASVDQLTADRSGMDLTSLDKSGPADLLQPDLFQADLTVVCTQPEVLCQGSCINLKTNVSHCGMCGQACAVQAGKDVSCQAGQCVYQRTIATLDGNQTLITSDSDAIYVSEDDDTPMGSNQRSRIVKINKTSGNRQTLVSALDGAPKALQIIGDMLYFVGRNALDNGRSVRKVALAGGQQPTFVTSLDQSGIDLIDGPSAFDGSNFYILRYDSNDNMYIISQTDLVGTAPVDFVRRPGRIRAVTVDSDNVYFSGDVASSYTIYKFPKTGDSPVPFITSVSTPFSLANDSANLYWLEYQSTGAVAKSAKLSALRESLASGHGNPTAIFLSSNFVYWTGYTAGLYRVATSGGTEQPLGSGYANGLTVDSTGRIYWLVYDSVSTKKTTLFETTF